MAANKKETVKPSHQEMRRYDVEKNQKPLEKLYYSIREKTFFRKLKELFNCTDYEYIKRENDNTFINFFAEQNIFIESKDTSDYKKNETSIVITKDEYHKLINAFKIDTSYPDFSYDIPTEEEVKRFGIIDPIKLTYEKKLFIRKALDDEFVFMPSNMIECSVDKALAARRKEIESSMIKEADEFYFLEQLQDIENYAKKEWLGNLINSAFELGCKFAKAQYINSGVAKIVKAKIKSVKTGKEKKEKNYIDKAYIYGKFIFEEIKNNADNNSIYLEDAISKAYQLIRKTHFKSKYIPGNLNKHPKSEVLKKYLITYLKKEYQNLFDECKDNHYLEYILENDEKLSYTLIR